VIAVLVPVLIGRVISFTIGVIWTRRRTRVAFRRSLLSAGLSEDEADSLASRYHARIPLRGLIGWKH